MYVCSSCNCMQTNSGPVDNIEDNIVDSHDETLNAGKRDGRMGLLDRLELAGGSRGGSLGDRDLTCWRGLAGMLPDSMDVVNGRPVSAPWRRDSGPDLVSRGPTVESTEIIPYQVKQRKCSPGGWAARADGMSRP